MKRFDSDDMPSAAAAADASSLVPPSQPSRASFDFGPHSSSASSPRPWLDEQLGFFLSAASAGAGRANKFNDRVKPAAAAGLVRAVRGVAAHGSLDGAMPTPYFGIIDSSSSQLSLADAVAAVDAAAAGTAGALRSPQLYTGSYPI